MPDGPLSLPARLLILAYDLRKDRVAGAPDLPLAIRAAVLVDLAARELIHEVDGVVTPVLDVRTGDKVLDELLEIIEESRPRRWRGWITHHARTTHASVRRALVADGYLRAERHRVLGVLPRTRYPLARTGYAKALRAEILDVLTGPADPRTVPADDAVLAVLAAAGHFNALVPRRARRAHAARLTALAATAGPHVPAIRTALEAAVTSAEAARSASASG